MKIRKKHEWDGEPHKIDWESKSVHISYPPGSLEQDWKEEALRHREEIEHLQHDLESEQNKTTKLAKRIHHALGYIEGAVEVDINYVCRILLGKEDD